MTSSAYGGRQVGMVPGTLRGYRFWRFDDVKMLLFPAHVSRCGAWAYGVNVAMCDRYFLPTEGRDDHSRFGPQAPPRADCGCGIYATYDHLTYRSHLPKFWINYGPVPSRLVHGSIKASGRIILGVKGFRAEKAEVEALWGWRSQLAALAYEVPWFRTRRQFLKEFPSNDMSNLLEEKQ